MTDEEYVRARWEDSVAFTMGPNPWTLRLPCGKYFDGTIDECWSGARAFTEQREREIAEVREEISEIEDDILSYSSHDNADSFAVIYRRILARLQARLAELRRGMKEGSE